MADKAIRTDVIIIGAGLSGLMAALTLQQSGKQFVVLEAQPRVGGRVFTNIHHGMNIDYGGQFVSPHQTRIQKLLRKYEISTTKTFNEGTTLYAFGDKKNWSNGEFPPFSIFTLLDFFGMERLLKKLLKNIDTKNPWDSKSAKQLDNYTMEAWLENVMSSQYGKAFYRAISEEVLGMDLNEISFLDVLWDLKSTGSLENVFTAEEEWIPDGAESLPNKMAADLEGHVKLNEPVRKVQWDETMVRVFTDKGEWVGRKVIMAIPPSFTNQIQYEPALPSIREEVCQCIGQGSTIKCVVVYDTPFWRERGESGMTFYDKGPVKETIDTSPPGQDKGILTAFIIGNDARRLAALEAESRKEEILDCLAYLFGSEALHPIAFYEKDWSGDPWARGGYGAHFAPGFLTKFGEALLKPIGPFHWAGTETATEWRLYMEGALEAGERAAIEVIELL